MNNKYEIISELNSGEFGKVYKGKHKLSNELVVIKIEKKNEISLLLYEIKIYNYLKNSYKYISKLRNYYSYLDNYIMIIDYNGNTLKEIKKEIYDYDYNNKKNIIKNIILELINAIEELHNLEYIYRDIKPQNFCYRDRLKVIDFGLCKKYINNDKHIENNKIKNIIGTINYVSKNILLLNSPSRRDDLESILYIFFYMYIPNNYWNYYNKLSNIIKKETNTIKKILIKLKNDKNYNNILLNIESIINYLNNIRLLKFYERPNYEEYKILIKSI